MTLDDDVYVFGNIGQILVLIRGLSLVNNIIVGSLVVARIKQTNTRKSKLERNHKKRWLLAARHFFTVLWMHCVEVDSVIQLFIAYTNKPEEDNCQNTSTRRVVREISIVMNKRRQLPCQHCQSIDFHFLAQTFETHPFSMFLAATGFSLSSPV